jgi:hypothetical protein
VGHGVTEVSGLPGAVTEPVQDRVQIADQTSCVDRGGVDPFLLIAQATNSGLPFQRLISDFAQHRDGAVEEILLALGR